MSQQPLRPLGLGEIIDTAFKVYTRHWRALVLLVAIVVVPAGIASYLILDAAVPPDVAEQLNDPTPVIDEELLEEMVRFLGAALLAALIQAAAAVLATAGSIRAVAEIYLGRKPDWRQSLGAAFNRLPAILGAGLLIAAAIGSLSAGLWALVGITAGNSSGSGALVALSLVASLVLVPWLAISWTVAIPVLVVEKAQPPTALARSFNLVRGRWWPTFGTVLTAWLIVAVLGGIASRILQAFLPDGGSVVAGLVVSVVISVATTPFIVAVLAVLYFDLRSRREPFHLSRLAADIGAPAGRAEFDRPPLPPASDQEDWPPLPPIQEGDGLPPVE